LLLGHNRKGIAVDQTLTSALADVRDAVTNIYVDNIRPLLVLDQVSP
jgi:hypothetical protein